MSTSLATSVSSDFAYTACYCEENVYLVCQQLCRSGKASIDASDLFVVFISNSDKKVPIWHQKAGLSGKDGFVIWDYHVICIQIFSESNTETLVWDLDTTLELPESFSKYMQESFRPSLDLHPSYQRLYRVVPAPLFLRYFSSDRRHMKTPEGLWAMPPPPYECIHGLGDSVHNLDEYITISNKDIRSSMDLTKEQISGEMFGVVVDHEGLKELFS